MQAMFAPESEAMVAYTAYVEGLAELVEAKAAVAKEIAALDIEKEYWNDVKGDLADYITEGEDAKLPEYAELIAKEENNIVVTLLDKSKANIHGLTRTLVQNMVTGVSAGFEKTLEINGVGYRAQKQRKKLILTLGYSHPVEMEEIEGITIEVPSQNQIIVKGCDKQLVGQVAANIREKRLPEPYKGKGIKYADERIRRKEGKAGGKK